MTTHLVIPDPHAHPDHDNNRFTLLGNLCADLRPDHVICIGDWADMPSLCSYDRGTKGFEGRRYKKDVESSIDALENFFAPLKHRKKKLPKFWMLIGNHEHRIIRAINADPYQLDGTISLSDLSYSEYGWEVVHYYGNSPGIISIDGVAYAHFFTSGVMGRPIGGEHPAYQMLTKQFTSTTAGHIHTTDYSVRTSANGNHIQALVSGCYIDYFANWAGEANKLWWKGVIFKDNVENGMYDPRWISMKAIVNEYGRN